MSARSYNHDCGIACALDLIGERWAMLIVRELLLGPRRFIDLQAGLPGIGSNTLTTRLSELECGGVISHRRLPAPAPAAVYELTPHGRELEPILISLAQWAGPTLLGSQQQPAMRASWIAIVMKSCFQARDAQELTVHLSLALPTGVLAIVIDHGRLHIADGPLAAADLRVSTREEVLLAVLTGRRTLNDAVAAGCMHVQGDLRRLARVLELCAPCAMGNGSDHSKFL